jgi:hypothetical protein
MNYDIIGGFENFLSTDDLITGHSTTTSQMSTGGNTFNWAKWWEKKDQSNQALVDAIK